MDVLGVRISHPDRVLWPGQGIRKIDLVRYYERIAPVLLRYAGQRPLTLRIFPRGVVQPGFYLKNAPRNRPPWVVTFRDVAESTGRPVDFIVATDARTLVWTAQYNAVEVHPWLSRVDMPHLPDWAVVDLDPSDETPWEWVARVALAARRVLDRDRLQAFPKLSGRSGLHLLVPLARVHPFDDVRAYFERVGQELVRLAPEIATVAYERSGRGRRVLVDYAQNARGKTTVAPYSVRPVAGAPVATPITWDELDAMRDRPRPSTMPTLFDRLDRVGDLLEPALNLHQRLPGSDRAASRPE